jgi:hypothetical protein
MRHEKKPGTVPARRGHVFQELLKFTAFEEAVTGKISVNRIS